SRVDPNLLSASPQAEALGAPCHNILSKQPACKVKSLLEGTALRPQARFRRTCIRARRLPHRTNDQRNARLMQKLSLPERPGWRDRAQELGFT
ncbi:hypothetical protein, partial [Pseudomonas syringae group genomosp. 7]|uniref:hypothetical protein n=1 Tax=Pseudomonas syringae group genomosp. 7 TaxID=251699 RepID=UPI00376F5AB0